jgi:hypothetical protein
VGGDEHTKECIALQFLILALLGRQKKAASAWNASLLAGHPCYISYPLGTLHGSSGQLT